jgi:pyridinium-3,5-bisthiocarboxylic acid mononucleotide nickel chelatase
MKIAYCDCFSGISGDMFLGALLDLGLDFSYLQRELASLNLPDPYELRLEEVHKGAFRAAQFSVVLPDELAKPGGAHEASHLGSHHEHSHHRNLADVILLVEESGLPGEVQAIALSIFKVLAQAEARVHGVPVEQIHFHEIGAVDSLVDIVGAAVGLQALGIRKLYASPLPMGGGQISSAHGILPLPAPATLELLSAVGAPTVAARGPGELVTPTGAAILAALAEFRQPGMLLERVGVSAGRKEFPWPNIFRLWLGEAPESDPAGVVLLETNLDDMNPEFYGHVMELLFEAGALDVYFTPIYMKKNRPAAMLSVLARPEHEAALANLLLRETSTLGLRVQTLRRYEAGRQVVTVLTRYGEIPVKLKILDGHPTAAAPEYSACSRAAMEHSVPVGEVYQAALQAAATYLDRDSQGE